MFHLLKFVFSGEVVFFDMFFFFRFFHHLYFMESNSLPFTAPSFEVTMCTLLGVYGKAMT